MKADKTDWFWFVTVTLIYILWVIWLGNYWFLAGIAIIFDLYISKKVNWTFWKKRHIKNSALIEWLDAVIFAVIFVTIINIFVFQNYKIPTPSMEKTLLVGDRLYVSKVAYGPRIPNTLLALPFTQHTLPFTHGTPSFVNWIKLPYKRLAGFGTIKRNDPVVFNFPEGDTVVLDYPTSTYYDIIRDSAETERLKDIYYRRKPKTAHEYYELGRSAVLRNFEIVVRPVDKRENYVKRCVAIPGDTLRIIDRQLFVNGIPQDYFKGTQFRYNIFLKPGEYISDKVFERMGVYNIRRSGNVIFTSLTQGNVEKIRHFKGVEDIQVSSYFDQYYYNYFPCDTGYLWTLDNFGPLYIPKKGTTIHLDQKNIALYSRVIACYENNKLEIKGDKIFINGKATDQYTFKMDYYWMMGDNRHESLDSRFWGMVPEDHIIGRPRLIWLSIDKNKKFLGKIRWNRMFKLV